MPIINVLLTPGRDQAQLQRFMRLVCDAAVKELQVEPASVRVLLQEVNEQHWSVGFETLAERRRSS